MRVAQVGLSDPPTTADIWRGIEARDALPPGEWVEDVINLAEGGRDFLAESETYDIVLVHSVMDPRWAAPIREAGGAAAPQVSPLDSYDAWRDRLLATGARWIIVFEGSRDLYGHYESLPGCLSGWHLNLPGYVTRSSPTRFTVFERTGPCALCGHDPFEHTAASTPDGIETPHCEACCAMDEPPADHYHAFKGEEIAPGPRRRRAAMSNPTSREASA